MGLSQKPADVKSREAQVMELLNSGYSPEEVSVEVGSSLAAVYKIRKRVIDRYTAQATEEYVAEDLSRCDGLIQAYWTMAREGNVKAARVVMNAMDHRAKITGSYAATKIEFSDVTPEQEKAEAEEIIGKFMPRVVKSA